jgi:hypothetical protein
MQMEARNRLVRVVTEKHSAEPYDSRFRRLVVAEAWQSLRPAIRARFSKRLSGTTAALYAGEIVETRFSRAGWLLAQICRLIGSPLPLHCDAGTPAIVTVTEDSVTGGQRWTRIYHRKQGKPQVINSAKAFAGPTGLEEHVGGGFGMALKVSATEDQLIFSSDHYFWNVYGLRLRIPAWAEPGKTIVVHRDLGAGRFAFDLSLTHCWFGELICQHAEFADQ